MAGSAEQEAGPRQPSGGRPARVTSIRKAIIIGALIALLVGGASSLTTARLTDRRSDLDKQRAEIAQLASQVSQQEAQIAHLTSQAGQGADEIDQLNAEIATLNGQVFALEAEKLRLEAHLSEILNPAPGPTPTAALTVIRLQHSSYGAIENIICVEIENTSDGDVMISYSYAQFAAIDGDNFVYQPRLPTPGYGVRLASPLTNGQLRAGEKTRGQLLYDVPGAKVLTKLVWNAGFGETSAITVDLPADHTLSTGVSPC